MVVKKKAAIYAKHCVACGTCVKACPKSAIHIESGVVAVINNEKCVGCGKCTKVCPASIIELEVIHDA